MKPDILYVGLLSRHVCNDNSISARFQVDLASLDIVGGLLTFGIYLS
jgi:hypothetical protein